MKIKQNITALTILVLSLISFSASAQVEATWYGSFNTGIRFNSTPITESKDIEVYNDQGSFLGLDAYSGYDTFYVRGRLEFDMNGSTLGGNIVTKQSFVELGQNGGFYRLGTIMSLTTQIMVQPNNIMHSQRAMEHIAFIHAESSAPFKANLFQIQIPYQQNLMTFLNLRWMLKMVKNY
ncbi:MAG: porin [Saccharospirillaceae bacterium]|nr:porin [Pseudomonadales bacterium]NRB79364.1 porin [Saccharospirillaceae bacterium]